MKIAFSTTPGQRRTDMGYGYAGIQIVNALKALGHEVPYGAKRAPVHLAFTQPQFYDFGQRQYRIGYTPWESTRLKRGWLSKMNACDEIWTTSDLCKDIFEAEGVKVPVHVYPHGINPVWRPVKRRVRSKLKILHVGYPASRKGTQEAIDAFVDAFGDNPDVQLTLKGYTHGIDLSTPSKNIKVLIEDMSDEQMVKLYQQHHIMLYPSYGEGFGFIPFQAAATGMPAIVNDWWCDYREYVYPGSYKLIDSPWPDEHPGKVAKPDHDDLVMFLRELADHIDDYLEQCYSLAPQLHAEYNWNRLTEKAFQHIVEKFA